MTLCTIFSLFFNIHLYIKLIPNVHTHSRANIKERIMCLANNVLVTGSVALADLAAKLVVLEPCGTVLHAQRLFAFDADARLGALTQRAAVLITLEAQRTLHRTRYLITTACHCCSYTPHTHARL